MTRRTVGSLLVPLFFILASTLWLVKLVVHPQGIVLWRGAEYSDLLVSHWPNANYIKQSLHSWGQIPLWNSLIFSGTPFAADPLSGLWYPPNWLILIMPTMMAFNVLFWLHLAWTGWGMYRWMRELGVGVAGALIAGLAWSGSPKWLAHIGLGHYSLVCAVSWTPWVLHLVHRTLVETRRGRNAWMRWSGLTGLGFGLSFLADPRWFLPLGLLCIAYALWFTFHHRLEDRDTQRTAISVHRLIAVGLLTAVITLGLILVLVLPMAEFLALSARAGLTTEESAAFSMPPSHLVGIWIPFFDQPEWLAYPGFSVLLLGVVALTARRPRVLFWWGVAIVSWLVALGDHTPLYTLMLKILPGVNLLRVPPRFLFLASFGLAILAGVGVENLVTKEWETRQRNSLRLSAAAITALVVLIGFGLWMVTRAGMFVLLTTTIVAMLSFIWLQVSTRDGIRPYVLILGWMLLLVVDLSLVGFQALEMYPDADALFDRSEVVKLIVDPDRTRVFSPSYSIPQQTAARYGLHLADGVNPMHLQRYKEYLAACVGFPLDDYSVTLPPFNTSDPRQSWELDVDAEMLGILNVGYIVADFPIKAEGIEFESEVDGVTVYRNDAVMPRAWLVSDDTIADPAAVEVTMLSPNRIVLAVQGPGTLILSEVDYPGWKVKIDGEPFELQRVFDLLRGVEVPPGRHQVVFTFEPPRVLWGGILSLLTLLIVGILWVRR